MEELKKAYETLGLSENASREEVENRYFLLLKKARAQQNRSNSNDASEGAPDLGDINRAYKLIIGVETEKGSTEAKQGKISHFFYYYKFHVIAVILLILVAGFFTKQTIDKKNEEAKLPPANLSVTAFGSFLAADPAVLEKNMLALVPEWKRIKTTVSYVPKEILSQQDMALQQKSVLNLMTEKSELYILDETSFKSLVNQHLFQKLDTLDGWSSIQAPPDRIRAIRTDEDSKEEPYGIDITGSPALKSLQTNGERQILAVRAANEKWTETRKLLEKLVQSVKPQ
ncbi:hypothetical protein SD71_05625 [Cohnella kolymensis]|uniref:J domain-containing protein n=1 Tax=Cohnella kolymensis TaxID=1590652 RepID=A0ABR5A775_9BACL|nr:hypothetical protein [Cohnella kolymensis]KIL36874.1 hypothetical protein SD71_05625 [Cohnella kolymensis]